MQNDVLRQAQAALESEREAAGRAVRALCPPEKRVCGLAPEHIRMSPEYRAAKARYQRAHEAVRSFNGKYAKALSA